MIFIKLHFLLIINDASMILYVYLIGQCSNF